LNTKLYFFHKQISKTAKIKRIHLRVTEVSEIFLKHATVSKKMFEIV